MRRRWVDPVEEEKLRELRKAASANLTALYARRGLLKPDRPKKLSELERASPEDILLGGIVEEFRELRKIENRYARKKHLSDDERAHWEEVDARLDTLRHEMEGYTRGELSRCVRLWNKSRKVRYAIPQS